MTAIEPRTPRRDGSVLQRGGRIYLRHPQREDAAAFIEAVSRSRSLHGTWVQPPRDHAAFRAYVERNQTLDTYEAMLICDIERDALAGVFNLSEIVRGAFQSAYLGYYALAPFARNGLMSEGLQLALRHAFTTMALHRVEANIQPGNAASIALVKRAGFRKEGFSPKYLKIAGRWRDHERWAVLAEEWG